MDVVKTSATSEPSLLKYARFYGLASNHLATESLESLLNQEDFHPVEVDETGLPALALPDTHDVLTETKFRLSKKECVIFASSIRPPSAPCWKDVLPHPRRIQKLKLEEPLLQTDHALDMGEFLQKESLDIDMLEIPFAGIDEVKGEALSWPDEYLSLANEGDQEIRREKLHTTREVILRLQQTVNDTCSPDMEAIYKEHLAYTKRPTTEPITPPLLPFDTPVKPYVPSSPALQLELLPDAVDPESPVRRESKQELLREGIQVDSAKDEVDPNRVKELLVLAEKGPTIEEKDWLVLHHGNAPDPSKRRIAEIVKFDTPMTPPDTIARAASFRKSVSFAATLEEFVPDFPPPELDTDDIKTIIEEDDFEQFASKTSEDIEDLLKEERLEPASLMTKENVPKLYSADIVPPWSAPEATRLRETVLEELYADLDKSVYSVNRETELGLSWVPYPASCGEIDLNESIKEGASLKVMLEPPRDIIRSVDMLWRTERLRIFDESEDSEEELLEKDLPLHPELVTQPMMPKKRPSCSKVPTPSSPLLGSFSASSSLSTFMSTRGEIAKKQKLTASHHFPDQTAPELVATARRQQVDRPIVEVPTTLTTSLCRPLPKPSVPILASPCTVVFDSNLLQTQRPLIKFLEARGGSVLTMICRDMNSYLRKKIPFSEMTPAAPDIILSPTTALVFTPLQATMQRSLPGQGPPRSPILERIGRVAQSYEKVFIIVLLSVKGGTIDANTSQAVLSLQAFCASMRAISLVQMILTPAEVEDGPQVAAHEWTYALISKYGFVSRGEPVTFIQDETLWELFLRRAGMNPLAAAVVLGMLKKPENSGRSNFGKLVSSQSWGLRAFVQMDHCDRMERFGHVIGARAVEQVGRLFETVWSPDMYDDLQNMDVYSSIS